MIKYFDMTTSSEDINRQNIVRDLVYLKAEEMLVGKNLVQMRGTDSLDIRLDIPTAYKIDPQQVSEASLADLQTLKFFHINVEENKYQNRVLITHETKARQMQNTQVEFTLDAVANGLAVAKDTEIFTTLIAGAGQTQAASALWNTNTADPATDIGNAIGKIFTNTTILDADIANMMIAFPAKLWGHLSKPIQIGELQQSIKNWAEKEFRVSFLPTRQLTNSALCVINSPLTALHFMYTGDAVPTVEGGPVRGVGEEYIVTQYYKTLVVPASKTQATNNRICSITGIA